MADTKPPEQKSPVTGANPVSEAQTRVNEYQTQLPILEREVATLRGRAANLDPALVKAAKAENDALKKKALLLERALYALYADAFVPKLPDEMKQQYEALRQPAYEHFGNADPELWKNIVS